MEDFIREEEMRVLGVLIEKQMTTPEYYPMTVNSIKTACNQKTNRYPIVDYESDFVEDIISGLRRRKMLVVVSGPGMRSKKYEHNFKSLLFLSQKEMAVLAVLMLRGPQTVGELRGRTERMVKFDGLDEVEETLKDMIVESRQPFSLVQKLPMMPGQKEHRFVQTLTGAPNIEKLTAELVYDTPTSSSRPSQSARIDELTEKVDTLSQELAELKAAFDKFRQEFE